MGRHLTPFPIGAWAVLYSLFLLGMVGVAYGTRTHPRENTDDLIMVHQKVLQHNILIMSMATFNAGSMAGYAAAKHGDLMPVACPKGTDDFEVKSGGCK